MKPEPEQRQTIRKQDLVQRYAEILDKGCMTPQQREGFLREGDLPDILIQVSSGSSGAAPLRIPRTQDETNWLATKLMGHFAQAGLGVPQRLALLGGISHMEAGQKAKLEQAVAIRNFRGEELEALDRYDPQVISMYPSFAREIVADRSLELQSLSGIKLGGEPIFATDLRRIFERFPGVIVVEQFGSTEMPGIAFRRYAEASDSGYVLSTDRFLFHFESSDQWQPLVVRDAFPDRAFPIEEWFEMDDEAIVRDGVPVEIRRQNDATYPFRNDIEALLREGCIHVQLYPQQRELLYQAHPGCSFGPGARLAGELYRAIEEKPLRLVDSNKMPLVVDTAVMDRARLRR